MDTEKQPEKDQNSPKENGTAEVSSTTPDEISKRSLRVKTWKKIQDEKLNQRSKVFNKIPNFTGSEKAAELLAGTDEFKNAKNIKIPIDIAQEAIKVEATLAGKDVYMPPPKLSNCLYTRINLPADSNEDKKRELLKYQNWKKEFALPIALEDKCKLDMVVIGSVLVSRDGYRIGRGNGFVDLDIAILIETGAITKDTVIVTTVHDVQVTDKLPIELFQKYDTPVDLIVTPTEVIRVAKRLPRPTGIFWELLSERRLKIVPVLQVLKENEEKAGKVIVLKSEDTDVESNARRPRQRPRRYLRYRGRSRRSKSEHKPSESNEGDDEKPRIRRRFTGTRNRRRVQSKSEGEQSSSEMKENQKRGSSARPKRNNSNRDLCCFKVSNIARGVRVKDLKAELRKRNCNPIYISWKGGFGRCFLHFARRKGVDKEEAIQNISKSLGDLSLTIPNGNGEQTKTINLTVELLQNDNPNAANDNSNNNRIESVSTTSV